MYAQKSTLFGVKHACGNHAHGHGGATIFVFYWSDKPKYSNNTNETTESTKEGN